MKKHEKIKDSIIDEFYGEDIKNNIDKDLDDSEELNKKLTDLSDILDILEKEKIDFPINTMSIIQEAEEIKEKSASKKEVILFTIIASTVLYIYFSLTIFYGINLLIISQLVFMIVLPLFVIPRLFINGRGTK